MSVPPYFTYGSVFLMKFHLNYIVLRGALLVGGGLYVLHRRSVTPFPCGGYQSLLLYVCLVKTIMKVVHLLSLVDFQRHYLMSLLNVYVCVNRVIPFDIIMA